MEEITIVAAGNGSCVNTEQKCYAKSSILSLLVALCDYTSQL